MFFSTSSEYRSVADARHWHRDASVRGAFSMIKHHPPGELTLQTPFSHHTPIPRVNEDRSMDGEGATAEMDFLPYHELLGGLQLGENYWKQGGLRR